MTTDEPHDLSTADCGPTMDAPAPSPEDQAVSSLRIVPGDRIGPFKVLQLLGEGGFGAVYQCDQVEPVKRRVAVKIIKAGMDTADVVARFQAERQALAMMDHPSIAKVFEAGATPEGRPYFVMEYVRGIPITDYCSEHKLDIRARLELFAKVCDAVHHAHQKGIIHRDLKPGNILVGTDGGREPRPKIIDFGVAKATSQQLTEQTLFTQLGQMIGTPLYMSPEQAGVSSEDIDTRSDVYSLGVVLYQLICGRLPFGPEVLREKGYLEMQRVIREEDPPRPSTQITIQAKQSSEETTRIAFERQTSVQELAKTLKRELEWIPLKALRKDRTERYSTAEALADDVRRYLTGDALEAGPESTTYRLRKLLRRHRGPVVAASLVTLALIGGIIGTTTFAVEASSARAEAERQAGLAEANRELAEQKTVEVEAAAVALAEERDLAQTARARAEASMDFLASIFKGLDPDTARTQDTTLLNQILQDAAERVGTELADSPLVEAEVLSSIASAHEAIFEFRAALVELERLHALRLEHLGIEDPETLSDLLDMGRVHDKLGETEIAVQLWGEAVEGLLKTQTADFILTRLATNYYAGGLTRLGRVEEGIALRRRELAGLVEALGTATPQVTDARANLAHGLMMVGQHAEAAQLYEECLEFMNIAPGPTDPSTLSARQNWINCIGHLGREEEALTEYRSLLKDLTSVFPDDHPKIALCHFYIGSALLDLGRPTEAVEAISLSLDLHAAIYGIHHAGTLASARIQLAAMSDLEDWEAAAAFGETWFQHHMEAPMYGPSDARTAALAGRLGDIFRFWNELAPDPTRASKSKEYATIHEDWRAAQEEGEEG